MRAGALLLAGMAATALAAPEPAAQVLVLVLSASGPSAARFAVGARITPGQRLALGPGDSLLILEKGHTRRLAGPLATYSLMSADRVTTLGLLAQVAQSSSLKVRDQEARAVDGRRSRARSGAGPFLDVAGLTAKPYDRAASPLIADPRQDALPLARIVPGEARHVCLMRDEPLYVARDPRDDGWAARRLTVQDGAGTAETVELAAGELWRPLGERWRTAATVRVTPAGAATGLPGAEAEGTATVSAFDVTEDRPDRLLSLYAGEECGHQAQQLYRQLKAEVSPQP